MGKSFNLNSFRFAQMKIDEETGEILEEEVPNRSTLSFTSQNFSMCASFAESKILTS